MQQRRDQRAMRFVYAVITTGAVAIALMSLACTSKPSSKSSAEKRANRSSSGQASNDPGINLNCVYDRLQNPPESFHYVYKKISSDGSKVDQEADVTAQTI